MSEAARRQYTEEHEAGCRCGRCLHDLEYRKSTCVLPGCPDSSIGKVRHAWHDGKIRELTQKWNEAVAFLHAVLHKEDRPCANYPCDIFDFPGTYFPGVNHPDHDKYPCAMGTCPGTEGRVCLCVCHNQSGTISILPDSKDREPAGRASLDCEVALPRPRSPGSSRVIPASGERPVSDTTEPSGKRPPAPGIGRPRPTQTSRGRNVRARVRARSRKARLTPHTRTHT